MEKKGVSSNWRQHDMGFNEVGCVTVNKKKKTKLEGGRQNL